MHGMICFPMRIVLALEASEDTSGYGIAVTVLQPIVLSTTST